VGPSETRAKNTSNYLITNRYVKAVT